MPLSPSCLTPLILQEQVWVNKHHLGNLSLSVPDLAICIIESHLSLLISYLQKEQPEVRKYEVPRNAPCREVGNLLGMLEIWWWKELGAVERPVAVAIPHGQESCG